MFVEGVHYKVIEREVAYRLLRNCVHMWIRQRPEVSIKEKGSVHVIEQVRFDDSCIYLDAGYQWNGSNIVVDSPQCMRASAIHDAWCKGMRYGILKNTKRNWDRGVETYVAICRQDGLFYRDARLREAMMKLAGQFKFPRNA